MSQDNNRLSVPADTRQSLDKFFQGQNRMSQASPEQREASVGGGLRKSMVKLNDDVVIEDAILDQEQFRDYGRSPSSVGRPNEYGVYLSQNTRMPGERAAQPNLSKVSHEEEGAVRIGDDANIKMRGSAEESPGFEDRDDIEEDDDDSGGARVARGIQSTNMLQREVKNEGSILHRSFLDKLSESNAALKEHSLTDQKRDRAEYFDKDDMISQAKVHPQNLENLYLELIERETTLSVDRLRDHINKNHPKKMDPDLEEYRNWSMCQNVGSLFANACFSKKKMTAFLTNLGIGPTLFLMSLKSYLRLFLVLSVLAVPSCILLASGSQGDSLDLGGGLTELLSRVSLGNLGYQSSFACNQINLAQLQSNLTLSCPVGKFQRIVAVGLQNPENPDVCIKQLGMQQLAHATANGVTILTDQNSDNLDPESTIIQYFVDFSPQCSSYLNEELKHSQTLTYLTKKFSDTCVGQSNCNLDFDYRGLDSECLQEVLRRSFLSRHTELVSNLVDTANEDHQFLEWYLEIPAVAAQYEKDGEFTYGPDDTVPEPLLYLVAQCDNQILKLNYFDIQLSKSELNQFLITSDIILTILLIIGILTISNMQYDLCSEYDAHSVTPRDFTIVIDPLPAHLRTCPDELSLQLSIKKHLDAIMAGTEAPDISSQIALISFAVKDEPLQQIQLSRDVRSSFLELVQSHASSHALDDGRIKETEKQNKEVFKNLINDGVEKMKQGVDAYRRFQQARNSRLDLKENDEYNMTAFQENAFGQKVERVYISFNSMKDKLIVEHQIRQQSFKQLKQLTACGSRSESDSKKQYAGIKIENQSDLKQANDDEDKIETEFYITTGPSQLHHFSKLEPKVDESLLLALSTRPAKYEPDNILWNNFENRKRNHKVGLLLEVICIAATALVIQGSIEGFQSDYIHRIFAPETNIFANRTVQCSRTYTMFEAYEEIVASRDEQNIQTITCFCRQQYEVLSFSEFLDLDFNKFVIQQGDELVNPIPNYCQDWFQYYFYQKAQAVGPSLICVGLQNLLGVPLAWLTVKKYGFVSRDSAALKWFSLNYYMTFLNIGFILPFYSQHSQVADTLATDSDGTTATTAPTLFSRSWFLNVASSLGFAITLNFVLYYFIITVRVIIRLFRRYKDRQYMPVLAAAPQDGDAAQREPDDIEDKPESSQATQSMLHELYTGDKFDAAIVQSQVLTLLSICIMFCGTMPLLYFACLFGLCFFYWFNKLTMLKFNQIHANYNERLIISSFHLLAFPILLHLIVTYHILRLSPMLRAVMYPQEDFQNEVTLSELDAHLKSYPAELRHYEAFMAITITLYILYVFGYSTISALMQEGYCLFMPEKKPRSASSKKRHQKYLERPQAQTDNTAEDAQQNQSNIDAMRLSLEGRPLSTISRASSAMSRYSAKQSYKMQFNGAQKAEGSEEYLQRRIASTNYFGEVSFDTLHFLLRQTTRQAIACSQRINLYTHVVTVLQALDSHDPELQLFRSQILDLERFYESVLDNKNRMESQIDFYWQYVLKYFENGGDDEDQLENFGGGGRGPAANGALNGSRIHGQQDLRKSMQKLGKVLDGVVRSSVEGMKNEGGQAEQADPNQIELKVDSSQDQKAEPNARNGQNANLENDVRKLSQLNQLINSKLSERLRTITEQNHQIESTINGSLSVPLAKLNFLLQNYDEELLKNHGLPGRLRCRSRVQTYHILDSLEYRSASEDSAYFIGSSLGSPDLDKLFAHLIQTAELIISDPTILEKRLPKVAEPGQGRQSQPRHRLNALMEEQERGANKMTIEETIPASVTHRTDHRLLGTQQNGDDKHQQEPTVLLAEPARDLLQKQSNGRYSNAIVQRNSLVGDSRESRGILRDINATGIFPAQNDSHHLDI